MLRPFGCLLTLAFVVSAARADEIHFFRGNPKVNVRITEESYDVIKFRQARVEQSVPAESVKEVIYSSQPDRYLDGLGAMAAGAYDDAVALFLAAAGGASRSTQWVVQYSLYLAAESLERARSSTRPSRPMTA